MPIYSLKERTILRGYTWWRRVRRPQVLGFPEALRHIGRLLICLPSEPDDAQQAVTVIPDLVTCLQAKTLTVAGSAASTGVCDSLSVPVQVITIGADDHKWIGLPTADLVTRVTGDGLDVAIDLNPHLDVLTGALCLQTGATLRMCFLGPHRELFFNVQIAVSINEPSPPADTMDAASKTQDIGDAQRAEDETSVTSHQAHDITSSATPYIRFVHTVKGMMGKAENGRKKQPDDTTTQQ